MDERGSDGAGSGPDEVVVVEGAPDEEQHEHRDREARRPHPLLAQAVLLHEQPRGQGKPREQRDEREGI